MSSDHKAPQIRSLLDRLWWAWSYLLVAVLVDLATALWFFYSKDINNLHDPYGWEALEAVLARMWWALPVAGCSGLLGPASAWLGRMVRKSSSEL